MAAEEIDRSLVTPELLNRLRSLEQKNMSKNTPPSNNCRPPSDRERLECGQKIIRTYTEQLVPEHTLFDLSLSGPLSGNASGIIRGWLMDGQMLLGKLQALWDDVSAEKTIPEVAVLEARIAIRDMIYDLRPNVRFMPKLPGQQLGPRAELGQAYAACMDMIQELAELLRDPEDPGMTLTIRLR